jgi:hypothetical protein
MLGRGHLWGPLGPARSFDRARVWRLHIDRPVCRQSLRGFGSYTPLSRADSVLQMPESTLMVTSPRLLGGTCGTLTEDRPPCLTQADRGIRTSENVPRVDVALRMRDGVVGRASERHSERHLSRGMPTYIGLISPIVQGNSLCPSNLNGSRRGWELPGQVASGCQVRIGRLEII